MTLRKGMPQMGISGLGRVWAHTCKVGWVRKQGGLNGLGCTDRMVLRGLMGGGIIEVKVDLCLGIFLWIFFYIS